MNRKERIRIFLARKQSDLKTFCYLQLEFKYMLKKGSPLLVPGIRCLWLLPGIFYIVLITNHYWSDCIFIKQSKQKPIKPSPFVSWLTALIQTWIKTQDSRQFAGFASTDGRFYFLVIRYGMVISTNSSKNSDKDKSAQRSTLVVLRTTKNY